MEELISVIIPAYNCQSVIPRCLESVCGQTYKNLEIIVVNDGSEDDTLSVAMEWKKKDGRIQLINQGNRGVSAARNAALDMAGGDYITFIDADDFVDSAYMEALYSALRRNKLDICLCNYCAEYGMEENVEWNTMGHMDREAEDRGITIFTRTQGFNYLRYPDILQGVCCKLYRRTAIGNIRFREDIYVGEDALFLASVVQEDPVLGYMDRKLYHYVIHLNSAMRKEFNHQKYTVTTAWESIIELFRDVPEASCSAGARYAMQLRDIIMEEQGNPLFRKQYYSDMMRRYRRNLKYLIASPEIPVMKKLSGAGFVTFTGFYIHMRKLFRKSKGNPA